MDHLLSDLDHFLSSPRGGYSYFWDALNEELLYKPTFAMTSQNTPSLLTRRNWLRDAAIAASGTALLPSLLTSCTDHTIPPTVEEGDPRNALLGIDDLQRAAQNLTNMGKFLKDVHDNSTTYEFTVWNNLKDGTPPPQSWGNFILVNFLRVVEAILQAAEPATAAFVGAAFALLFDDLKAWESARPHGLNDEFTTFVSGHEAVHTAMQNRISHLTDPGDKNNFQNLRNEWRGALEFMGVKYTLWDLAHTHFPTRDNDGDKYVPLFNNAVLSFKQHLWNLMFIKVGTMTRSDYWTKTIVQNYTPTEYARDEWYHDPNNRSTYLRGFRNIALNRYVYRSYTFEFDGLQLSNSAAQFLFKDDTPHHEINPEGLFYRDYVFKQFHREKPDWEGYYDLRKTLDINPNDHSDSFGFDPNADSDPFTGGAFPELTKP